MSVTTQKDYLKKYLSIGKDSTEKKKRKKKVKSSAASRLVIIDDNADTFENAVKEDLLEDEDAPQIVAVIDDRPPSLRVDEKNNTNLWIPIGGSNNVNSIESSSNSLRNDHFRDLSPPRNRINKLYSKKNEDMSPPRRQSSSVKHNSDNEIIKIKEEREDMSPPRKNSNKIIDNKITQIKEENEDMSPPRKSSTSLSRILIKDNSSRRRSEYVDKEFDDMSPPRKRSKDTYPEKGNKKRSSRWESEGISASSSRHDLDKSKNKNRIEDNSPPRKRREVGHQTKMVKTLDGKTAGLQKANQLASEATLIKEEERDLYNRLSSEMSGTNTTMIFRDRKTSRVRNFQEEAAIDLEKKKKEDENKEKYSRWGRGLKQVEDATKRRDEELNEMNKPLARYANDEDLERYLKEQEREGDPMLAYIRKKKRKNDVQEGKPMKPEYMGEFMPNRFGIRPGHRWDGVDRSNGYEKKWLDIQNSRIAQQEEAYKWSTEDM